MAYNAGSTLMANRLQKKLDASRRTVSSPEFQISNSSKSPEDKSISGTNSTKLSKGISSASQMYQNSDAFRPQLFTSLSSTDLWNSVNRTSEYLRNFNRFQ